MLGAGLRGTNCGYFERGPLRILSSGTPEKGLPQWEHVSVSCDGRCPTWDEMAKVKDMFWGEDETVVQFHPRRDQHVNLHHYCLHLCKKCGSAFELPPTQCV